jgi:serine protease inhibitor
VTVAPPVLLADRFSDRDSAVFKKSLSYDKDLAESMELFAIELLSTFNAHLKIENFMISPFSIYHLLVLIAEGAKGNTYNEINEKLKMIDLPRTRDFQQYLNVALKQVVGENYSKGDSDFGIFF